MSFRVFATTFTVVAFLVLAGCVETPPLQSAREPEPNAFVARVPPKALVYDFKELLVGQSSTAAVPLLPTRVDTFEVPSNATNVNTVAELRCAAGAIGRIVFEWREAKSTQTSGEYTMVGDYERDVCVTSGSDPPFKPPELGPGNHTVSYYVAGMARAHVEVVITFARPGVSNATEP